MGSQAALIVAATATYYKGGREAGDFRRLGVGFAPIVGYLVLVWLSPMWSELLIGPSSHFINQHSRAGTLRTIVAAEITYDWTYTMGFSPMLSAKRPGVGSAANTPLAAGLIEKNVADGRDIDCIYTHTSVRNDAGYVKSFKVSARPKVECKKPGSPSCFTNESGVIRETREYRHATVHDPPIAG